MIDEVTQKPIQVHPGVVAGPHLKVPLTQLEGIQRVLDAGQLAYWVSTRAISIDKEPYRVRIQFFERVKPELVQTVLDAAD